MNKTMKKALALVLMMIMVLSSVPMTSFAANALCIAGHKWGDYTVTKAATCIATGEKVASCTRNGCDATNKQTIAIDTVKGHKEKAVKFEDSTCAEYGNKAGVICELCGVTLEGNERIEPKGHKSVALAAKDPTCTEDGNEKGTKCEVCGKVLSAKIIEKTGHNYTLLEQDAANCKTGQAGTRKDVCLNCGDIKVTPVEAKHTYGIWRTDTEATCEHDGLKIRRCTVSGCSGYETQVVAKLNHVEEAIVAKEATCTAAGITAGKKCKNCNATLQGGVTIPAKGHNYITVEGKAPTCDVAGYSDSKHCSACGIIDKEAEVINATGHKLELDEKNSKAANCTTEGVNVYVCKNQGCTYTKREVLPITHESNNWVKISDPTCTTDGIERGYCKYCGKYADRVTKATGHAITDMSWSTDRYPDCTKVGKESATCAVCHQKVTREVPALGHNPVTKTAAKAPTCTAEGATESKACSRCDEIITASEVLAKLPHEYGEWKEIKAATCAMAGAKEATCKKCSYKATEPIAKTEHQTEDIAAVPATCTADGTTAGKKCKDCGLVTVAPQVEAKLGHDFSLEKDYLAPTCTEPGKDNGKCSRCGEVQTKVLEATGHTEVVIPGEAATCELGGFSDGKTCSVCNAVIATQDPIAPLGHDLVLNTEKSTPATCTQKGFSYSECTRCAEVEQKEVALLEHAWGEWIVTTPASCEATGEETRTCSTCNTIEPRSIPSLEGHVMVTVPGTPATCKEPGKTSGTSCERCGTVFEAQEVIEKLAHELGEAQIIAKATTTADGLYGYPCLLCGEAVNSTVIPKIDEASIKLSTTKFYYNGKVRKPDVTIKDTDGNVLAEGEDFETVYDAGRKNPGKYNVKVSLIGNYEGEIDLAFSINPVKTAKVSYENKSDHILITWDKVTGATGYDVYIYQDSESGTTRKLVKTLTGTSYKLTKDYNGKALQLDESYRIGVVSRTRAADDTILKSKEATIKVVERKLQKPTLTVTTASGKATLKWTNIANETGYEVVYATSKDGTYKKLTTTKANVVTYTKAFTRGSTVYFKVRAYKTIDGEKVYSNYSSIKSIKIK